MKRSTDGLILAADAAVDLQVHTVYSDGTWQPEQLIDMLIDQQFGLVAITDHDRPDIAPMLQALAIEKQFPVLVAAELTAEWRGEMVDVLCYGFELENNALMELTQDLLRRQQNNTRGVYDSLLSQGYRFSEEITTGGSADSLETILAKPSAQQPHELVSLMNRHGYGTAEQSAGRIVMAAGLTFATSPIGIAVEAAHRSGGICLLAHPGRGDIFIRFDTALLDELRAEVPIDGIEAYYPAHSEAQIAEYLNYAETHQLLVSSGSDSHGPEKPPIRYHAGLSRQLLERLGIQVV